MTFDQFKNMMDLLEKQYDQKIPNIGVLYDIFRFIDI